MEQPTVISQVKVSYTPLFAGFMWSEEGESIVTNQGDPVPEFKDKGAFAYEVRMYTEKETVVDGEEFKKTQQISKWRIYAEGYTIYYPGTPEWDERITGTLLSNMTNNYPDSPAIITRIGNAQPLFDEDLVMMAGIPVTWKGL